MTKDNGRGRALVTGATGFLGPYLAAELAAHGYTVTALDRRPPAADLRLRHPGVAWVEMSLPSPDLDALLSAVRPDVLVHAAGPASVPASVEDPAGDFHGGVDAFFQVVDSVRRRSPRSRVVLLSSAAVYGNPAELPVREDAERRPLSPYGFHKLICEELAEEFHTVYGLSAVSVRVFSAYGPGLRRQVLWDICRKAFADPEILLDGTGRESRDFVHAEDVARGVAAVAGEGAFDGGAYNLATGAETTVAALADLLLESFGVAKRVQFTGRERRGDPLRWRADIGRIGALGYRPRVAIEDGVARFARGVLAELRPAGAKVS